MRADSTRAARGATVDRRAARAVATRAAVVDALLALLEAGELRPTAPRIAARAGVSLRSVFQHFNDLEALFAAAADRQTERLRPLLHRLPRGGSLAERVAAFVAQRDRVCTAIAPVRRAALLMEPFSAAVAKRLAVARALGRREIEQVFAPELARHPAGARREIVAALAALGSFSGWHDLRAHQRLSPAAARRALARAIEALLTVR